MPLARPRSRSTALASTIWGVASTSASAMARSAASLVARVAVASVREAFLARWAMPRTAAVTSVLPGTSGASVIGWSSDVVIPPG